MREPYWTIPAAWLAIAFVVLWVDDPRHVRTRRLLGALILPAVGLADRARKTIRTKGRTR